MTLRDTVNEVRANLVQVTSRAEAAADATNSAHQQAIEQHRTDVDQARVVAREVEGAMRELATDAEVMKGEIATLSTAGKALEEEVVALKSDIELERRARDTAARDLSAAQVRIAELDRTMADARLALEQAEQQQIRYEAAAEEERARLEKAGEEDSRRMAEAHGGEVAQLEEVVAGLKAKHAAFHDEMIASGEQLETLKGVWPRGCGRVWISPFLSRSHAHSVTLGRFPCSLRSLARKPRGDAAAGPRRGIGAGPKRCRLGQK